MKHIKRILTIAAAVSCTMAVSCNSLLEIPQHGVTNSDQFYQTDSDIESAGAAMYYDMRSQAESMMMLKNALDDDFYAGGGGRGDNTIVEQLDEFTFDAENSSVTGYFSGLYTVIFDANTILQRVDPAKSDVAARIYNEAKVFRGFCYFELITLWGNVPLVDHVLNADEYQIGNSTPEELWGLVEKDLTEAINSGSLLEKTDIDDNVTWQVTKQFAQAVLGKAYLWQDKDSEAARMFDEVINSGKYGLFQGDYGEMLDVNNKHHRESILEFDHPYDLNNQTTNFLNGMAHWRVDKLNGVPQDIAQSGYGFYPPTKDLYEEFVRVEGEDGYRLNQTMRTYAQLQEMGISVKEPIISEGYFMWKSRLKADQIIGMPWVTCRNVSVMRYAEVLLLAAEANLEIDNAKATRYFNEIRARAQAPEVGSVTLEDIQVEKRLELCYEATRWQDLVRWGIAYDKLKNHGNQMPMLQLDGSVTYVDLGNPEYGFKQGKHELLPFPADEMRVNKVIKQNPGY